MPFRYTPIFILPHSHSLPYVIPHYPHFFISSSFLFYSSYHSLLFSFSLSSHFITSHFTSSFSLSPLSFYSSIHSNHIPCLLSSSHLHHAHHLAYSSIIHPTSSSFHSPSIPSLSHFSLFHSSISPWCSSRFPQNSFSLISFIIPSYSLFHPPFHPISTPSPSSPHISVFQSYSHLCSVFIHFHPFPSHSIPFHHFHSFAISLLTPHIFIGTLPFIIHRSLSFHPFLFSFLSLPSYIYHSYRFFASHLRFSTLRSIPCLFLYSLSHYHLLC